MYQLIKEAGYNSNVTIINTESGSSVIVGRLTTPILKTLEAAGFTIDSDKPDHLVLKDRWKLALPKDTADELAKTAMAMRKPPKRKKTTTRTTATTYTATPEPTDEPKEVNALDVLLGFAHYNKEGDD